MSPLIKLENISFAYHRGQANEMSALKEVSIEINEGDFIAISGVSGSGKSTLLHILGGLIKPDSGIYLFKGENITGYTDSYFAKLRNEEFGYILQDYGLLCDRTALENVCMPLLFSRCPWNQIKKRGYDSLKAMGILELKDKRPNEMSGGQCQRVAIARALINKPKVILADEPTGALDSHNTEKLMDLLKEINTCGTSIVLVTHDHDLLCYCNKQYEISDGKIHIIKEKNK